MFWYTLLLCYSLLITKTNQAIMDGMVKILHVAKVEKKGQVILSPVHKVIQDDSGQWRLSSTKHQARDLPEWAEVVAKLLLPVYSVEGIGAEAPTISIDEKIATKHAVETQHGPQCAPLHKTPSSLWRPPVEATTRENIDWRKSEDEGREMGQWPTKRINGEIRRATNAGHT